MAGLKHLLKSAENVNGITILRYTGCTVYNNWNVDTIFGETEGSVNEEETEFGS